MPAVPPRGARAPQARPRGSRAGHDEGPAQPEGRRRALARDEEGNDLARREEDRDVETEGATESPRRLIDEEAVAGEKERAGHQSPAPASETEAHEEISRDLEDRGQAEVDEHHVTPPCSGSGAVGAEVAGGKGP